MSGGPQVFLGATTFCSRCHQISGRREACPPARRPRCEVCWAGLLGVPVGGGPPASRPRRELRSARRLEARPGPATAHGHRSRAPPPSVLLCTPLSSGRRASKPARALPSLRRPPHQWGPVADSLRRLNTQPGPSTPWCYRTAHSQSSLSIRNGPGWCVTIRGPIGAVFRQANASSLPRRCMRRSPPR